MSVPKQRHSKARQARGRVRYVKSVKNSVACPKCGASISSHRVCPKCGFYKNREYVNTLKKASASTKKEQQ
ncbi:MAG: 50S ribosomal protein L32 [Candidatus Moraniibacteriota bacterium]|nr:MAG: 50S ribosomal protein L32 [Candidatus Moranbacteria bacterium]